VHNEHTRERLIALLLQLRTASQISEKGPLGPYEAKDVAVPTFAHNPKVARAPDGTWLMYTIGTPVAKSKLVNCTAPHGLPRSASAATPGRTPGNLESNVTLYTR
jgi:hypothetical protein